MNLITRMCMKVLVVVVGVGAAGIVAERHLAASPLPVNSTKADSPPRVEVVRPRRVTVAQRLQTNATLAAFEEADLFAKISGYVSDVRVDIGDHVKAGQVLGDRRSRNGAGAGRGQGPARIQEKFARECEPSI